MASEIKKQAKIAIATLQAMRYGDLGGDKMPGSYDIIAGFAPPANRELGAVLKADGYQHIVNITPEYNNPRGKLITRDWKESANSDYLLCSVLTRATDETAQFARKIKELNPKTKIIAGGWHPTFRPEECLEYADAVVIGEGELTLPELIQAYENGGQPEGVEGVVYRVKDEIFYNPSRRLLTQDEYSALPLPLYDTETLHRWSVDVLNSSRGCTYDCDFCSVHRMYHRRYRSASLDSAMAKVVLSNRMKPGGRVVWGDDNFALNKGRTMELAERIEYFQLTQNKKMSFIGQFHISAGLDDQLLVQLRKAGFDAAMLGVEAINQEALDQYNKGTTIDQIESSVENFARHGFWVHGMFVMGGRLDTPEYLEEMLLWAKKRVHSVQFAILTPFPGTRVEEKLRAEGRLYKKVPSHYYDAEHVIFKPENISSKELQEWVKTIHRRFYGPDIIWRNVKGEPSLKERLLRGQLGRYVKSCVYFTAVQKTLHKLVNDSEVKDYVQDLASWEKSWDERFSKRD